MILSMREYQKQNNISGHCVTNTQYLYDLIKHNFKKTNVKAKAFFVLSYDENTGISIIVSGHLAIVLDDTDIIEPSYNIFCRKNTYYFDNIKDLMNSMNEINNKHTFKSKENIRKLIFDYIEFNKIATSINNGELCVSDKLYYNQQADYIKSVFKYII